jgi:hypothetical protein
MRIETAVTRLAQFPAKREVEKHDNHTEGTERIQQVQYQAEIGPPEGAKGGEIAGIQQVQYQAKSDLPEGVEEGPIERIRQVRYQVKKGMGTDQTSGAHEDNRGDIERTLQAVFQARSCRTKVKRATRFHGI